MRLLPIFLYSLKKQTDGKTVQLFTDTKPNRFYFKMVLKSMRFRLGTLLWISLFLVLVGVLTSSQNVGRTQTQYIKGDDSRLEGKHLRVVLGEVI